MTVLSVYEVSQRIFFQGSTDAGYRLLSPKFKCSRSQHATNKAVEHLDADLLLTFLTTPSSTVRIKTSKSEQ